MLSGFDNCAHFEYEDFYLLNSVGLHPNTLGKALLSLNNNFSQIMPFFQEYFYHRGIYLTFIILIEMFSFCCCRKSNPKGVKSLEVFNKNFSFRPSKLTKLLSAENSQKSEAILKSKTVLASMPIKKKHKDIQQLYSGKLQSHPKKTILKSEYDNLVASFSGSDRLWEDPDFPPNASSWGFQQQVFWRRISKMIPDAKFVQNNFSPSDILQGKTGNCYFLSSVAGIAEQPDRIVKIFPNTSMNKNGIYMARILYKGVFQEVVVDDFFPFSDKGDLLCAKPAGGNEIWVMIIQKCWAKMYGSYMAIQGGFPDEVLRAISAAPTYHFDMTDEMINSDETLLDKMWRRLVVAEEKSYVMCAGSIAQDEEITKLGLVTGHAYTIVNYTVTQLSVWEIPDRIVKLRNPWGHREWNGKANQKDISFWSKIDEEMKEKIGFYENKIDDGIFFMLWEDFTKFFNALDICHYEDNAHYFYYEETFQKYQPIFYEVETKGGNLTFVLSQTPIRGLSLTNNTQDLRLADATFVLGKVISNQKIEYVSSSMSSIISDFCLEAKDLEAGTYVLASFVDGLDKEIKATVSVYTESNTTLQKSKLYNNQTLQKIFINHASKNPEQQLLNETPLEWLCFSYIPESKFGYCVFHLDKESTTSLEILFDESQYINSPFTLLPEYKGRGKFKEICKAGQEVAVLCKVYPCDSVENNQSGEFPVPRINRIR